jgi:hypothetical protein
MSFLKEGIVKYLTASQFASWNILKKNINGLYLSLYGNGVDVPENLEYKVLYPLLRAGIIETARRPASDKLVYCLGPEIIYNKINQNDSLKLLKNIPSLVTIITHWQKSETQVYFIYERFDKNHFKTARDTSLPQIYTNKDRVYSNRYIRIENGALCLIPEMEDNIDGFNIACCYLKSLKGLPFFTFNINTKTLTCLCFHSILPVVICRALILCDPTVLSGDMFNNNGKAVIINNVSKDHVKELKRIFGENTVEEKNG